MRFGVIGTGPAGLVATKYCLQNGYDCDVYEQTGSIGGTWVYTDLIGMDEDGIRIHTSMYKNLTTTFPKELMTYADFPYPENKIKSYISQEEVLEYLHAYANRFALKNVIRFYRKVVKVTPESQNKWILTVENVKTGYKEFKHYDAIFICNGRFFDPIIPNTFGRKEFQGSQCHSRDFRTPEPYKNRRVLIIGGSISGQELTLKISETAKHIFLSHRKPLFIELPQNATSKPEVAKIVRNGAEFIDGTREEFDSILYCTEDNWVRPLYKQVINVQFPTMYFIGLPYIVCDIPMFELQVQFALASFQAKFILPHKQDMIVELDEYMKKRRERGIPDQQAHLLGTPEAQKEYFQELSDTAGLPRIPSVINKLYARIKTCPKLKCCFKIVDDENFLIIG
ncbi:hypothetical protein FQR65_LT04450 [Abscondita terminalis]|nr:hypothetical protein FQR65_LT04450 [Abscondita terminalis]